MQTSIKTTEKDYMKKYGLAGSAFGIIVMMQGADNTSSFPKPKEPCLITATGAEVIISPDFIKRSVTLLNMMDTTENQQLKVPMPFTDDIKTVSALIYQYLLLQYPQIIPKFHSC